MTKKAEKIVNVKAFAKKEILDIRKKLRDVIYRRDFEVLKDRVAALEELKLAR